MFPKIAKSITLASALLVSFQLINASEPTFPRPNKENLKVSLLPKGKLSPVTLLESNNMITSVDSNGERWRASVTMPKAGVLQLFLTTGKGNRASSRNISQLWASYNMDWMSSLNNGRTVTFRYTLGQSTVGIQKSFRFGCSDLSRKSAELEDTALTLIYGGTACRFSIDGKETSGDLPKPVTAGTEIVIEVSPSKLATISVGDTLILQDQPLDFSECFISFVSDSSNLKSQNSYSDLRISNFTVEQD
ncbi:MAG: hypothetical protein AAGC73_05835 [Verrucomicrobiota bacterium]